MTRTPKITDAITLLQADHRRIERWFVQFERARGDDRKLELAINLCAALRLHALVEQEIFYAAFLDSTGDRQRHHEATVEHDAAAHLISEIEAATPADEFFDAKVNVLAAMVRNHVVDEEGPGGMFAVARESDMDLVALGERIRERGRAAAGPFGNLAAPARAKSGILGRILEVASR
jgi:hypothetical protein